MCWLQEKNLIKKPIFLKNHVFWTQFKGKVKIPTGTFYENISISVEIARKYERSCAKVLTLL